MQVSDELLSWKETMIALGVSSPTLYAIVDARQELTAARIVQSGQQQRRYFRKVDVEALRRQRAGEQTPEVIGGAATV